MAGLTLEERERLAYITNSPEHRFIVAALEGEDNLAADLQRAEQQKEDLESDNERLREDVEEAEKRATDAQDRVRLLAKDVEKVLRSHGV